MVVISAADTPGARVWRPACAWWEMAVKTSITPQTVPKRPRKGAPDTIEARKIMLLS
jgi:hypothetical protein